MEKDFTAKEKAQDLVTKFTFERQEHEKFVAKECAKICVDEIIDSKPMSPYNGGYFELNSDRIDEVILYWEQVKAEIEKL